MPRIYAPRGHHAAPQSLVARDRHLTLMRLSLGKWEVALTDRNELEKVDYDPAKAVISCDLYGSLPLALDHFRRVAEELSPGVTSPGNVPTHPSARLPR